MCREVSRAAGVSRKEPEGVLKGVWKGLVWRNTRETGNGNQRPREGLLWAHPSLVPSRVSQGAWGLAQCRAHLGSLATAQHSPHTTQAPSRGLQGWPVLETAILWGFGMGPSDIKRVCEANK